MKIRKQLVFLLIFLSVFFMAAAASASGDVPQKVLDLRKSVVRVVCQTTDGAYTGSGFAIGRDMPVKYIVTNLHVVSPNINGVSILRENNEQAKARVYLQVPNADLCVLLLDEPLYNVPPLELADAREAGAGQAVYTLGFPGAADFLSDKMTGDPQDVTITDGIVSAVKSLTLVKDGTPIRLLQINAAINHGNSGGPLVNESGQVLGVNSLGAADSQNINGAVSILELTSALKGNGIAYLPAGAAGPPTFPYWLVIGAAALVAAGIVTFLLLRRRKKASRKNKKSVLLPEYLLSWGGRLPWDMAARVLENMIRELATLHAAGRCHGDVCPENLRIEGNKAFLQAPENETGGRLVLRPGFSAPEQYRADGRVGPWSDVYSACAVLYYAVTGIRPLGVLERQALSGGDIGFAEANIDDAHAQALLAGMSIEAGARPQSCVELIRALGMPEAAAASVESTAAAASSGAEQKNPRARKKWSAGKRALIIGACVLGALCLGAGGYWYYNDSMYNQAIACIGRQDYTKGVDDLKQILSIYKASGKYMAYACAGNALQSNQFDNARGLFKSLGGFNGADKMLTEVDYQQALYLLTQGNFDQSKAMFAALGSYKDSAQMMLECDYQKAVAQLQNGEFQNAIDGFTALAKSSYKDSANMALEAKYEYAIDTAKRADLENAYQMFKNLGLYKDSAQNMSIVAETLYEKAVNYYHINAYTKALLLFKLITPYQYSDSYILLISVHFCSIDFADLTTLDYLSNRLETLGNFEDAAILNDEIVATIINRLKYR